MHTSPVDEDVMDIPSESRIIRGDLRPPAQDVLVHRADCMQIEMVRDTWVPFGVGVIPYCLKCVNPVDIVTGEDPIIFRCPSCKRTWSKDEDWRNRGVNHKGSLDKAGGGGHGGR